MPVYTVYDETDKYTPKMKYSFAYLETAKNYVRSVIEPWRVRNKTYEYERDEIRGTWVIRCGKRLIFLATSDESRLWINRPGGMSVKTGYSGRDPVMVGQPGMGGCGYSNDALKIRYSGDRSGRLKADRETPQDYEPVKSTPWCERWKTQNDKKEKEMWEWKQQRKKKQPRDA